MDVAEGKGEAGICSPLVAQLLESTRSLEPREVRAPDHTCKHWAMSYLINWLCDPNWKNVPGYFNVEDKEMILENRPANADRSDCPGMKTGSSQGYSRQNNWSWEDLEAIMRRDDFQPLMIPKDLEETEAEGVCSVALPSRKKELKTDVDVDITGPSSSPDLDSVSFVSASSCLHNNGKTATDIDVAWQSYGRKEEVLSSHGGEGWSSTSDHPALGQVHRSARSTRPPLFGAGVHTEGGSFPHHTITRAESVSQETTADVNDSIQNESCGPFTPHLDITRSLCTNSSKPMFSTDNDVVKHNQRRESITPTKARGELMSHPSDVVQLQVQHDAGERATGTFSCRRCMKSLSGEMGLQRHIKSQHEDGKKHNCPHCHGKFVAPSHLRNHIDSVHGKLRPYDCSQCEKKFSTKSYLNQHISLVHDQVKEYSCLACGRKFGRRGTLNRHFQALHDNVRHKCPKCAKTFSHKSNMKSHMKNIHDAK